MQDYDKLFADGNVIGIKVLSSNKFYNYIVDNRNINNNSFWSYYKNNALTDKDDSDFEIQYIIRLDEHGNVIEKLFDREKDMPKPMPELKTGMFVRLADKTNWKDNTVAYVDHQNNRLIAKEGWFEALSRKDEWRYLRIVEVFSKNVCCFNLCVDNSVIWRSPEYQAYLDSKSN